MILLFVFLLQDIGTLSSQGAAAMREKRFPDAVRTYREAVSRDPATPEWRLNLGLALAYSNQHQEAVTVLGEYLKARPAAGPAYFVSGLSMLKLGRHCDAIPLLETARRWKASSDVSIELGDAYQGCKRWELAAAAYERAAEGRAAERKLARQIAHCWWMARRYDKALPVYRKLEPLFRDDAGFLFEYGDTLVRAEGAEAGLSFLEKAVAAAPGLIEARGALGRALMELGRAADAIPHLEAASAADPAVLLSLSRAYRALGRSEDAARAEAEYKAKVGGR